MSRRAAIVEAFVHSWRGYERHAWGYDELRPVSNKPNDAWGGFAVTMIDALDTAYLMNLTAEFGRATDWLAAHLVVDRDHYVSVFEHTIRVFGGLLSAFDLSGDERLLRLAVAAATRLLPAFKESDGLPSAQVNTRSGERRSHGWAPGKILSEAGSVQLEFMRLYTILSVRMMPSARARGVPPLRTTEQCVVLDWPRRLGGTDPSSCSQLCTHRARGRCSRVVMLSW